MTETGSTTMTGGCQCGRIRYSVAVDTDDAYLCHCRMCQRATGGVAAAFRNVARDAVTWTTQPPDLFRSSPIAERGFCQACGTPLTFWYVDADAKNFDLTVGSFDDPSRFRPTANFGAEGMHPNWIDVADLPATRSDDYAPLVKKWEAVGGERA